jgi:hypothetical protein
MYVTTLKQDEHLHFFCLLHLCVLVAIFHQSLKTANTSFGNMGTRVKKKLIHEKFARRLHLRESLLPLNTKTVCHSIFL